MLIIILTLLIILLTSIYLIFLFNSKEFWLNSSYQSQSLLSVANAVSTNPYHVFMLNLGSRIATWMPRQSIEQLEFEYFHLDRSRDDMFQTIAEASVIFVLMLLVYLFNHSLIFLFLSILFPVSLILEINLAMFQFKKEIEASVEHLVRCLKVLVIKSETPILNALEIIMRDLPDEYRASKRELLKLINKSTKTGLRTTLLEWKTDLTKFRDFIALLISINDGANKHALKLSFDNFLQKIEESKADEIKNQAENVQLYLMVPVVLMLIVLSLPMVDAIRFLMMEAIS